MIKKINISELKAGMRVCGVGKERGDDFFFMNNILIMKKDDIMKLVNKGFTKVYVEIADEPQHAKGFVDGKDNPEKDVESDCKEPAWPVLGSDNLNSAVTPPQAENSGQEPVEFDKELEIAQKIREEALLAIKGIMQDIRLGKNIDQVRIYGTVGNIVGSIFRNRHALTSLARLKSYDNYTFSHSLNVCILSIALGRNMGLSREDLHTLGAGSLLHDVGKVLLPEKLINKPGNFTPAEFKKVQQHPKLGADFLSGAGEMREDALHVVSQHHEKYDGNGYPDGIKGDSISRFARITGLADMYDAMTSDRVYRRRLLPTEVLKILYLRRENYFGQGLVEAFIRSIGIYPIGSTVELNTGEAAVVKSVNQNRLLQPVVSVILDKDKRPYPKPFDKDLQKEDALCIEGVLDSKSLAIA